MYAFRKWLATHHCLSYCIIPFHHFISGNEAHTDETKIRQEDRESRAHARTHARTHTHTVKPVLILLKQETVSGSGICWAICKSAPRSSQKTMPVPHYSVFLRGRMPFLPPNQHCQSTEGRRQRISTEKKDKSTDSQRSCHTCTLFCKQC